ncbi:AsmA family protein [Rhodopseudomonas telluris]|uniref:AsmA family protein n=1 Tax=Rhodopseudomonas telluris TaxID=644215 RepID=A0ABV6ELL6_9BRAD
MRLSRMAGLVIAVLIAVAAVLLTVGIPSGAITSAIEARVARDTGYRIAIAGSSKVSLFPGFNLTLTDVTIDDPNNRSPDRRLTIASLRAALPLASLISGAPQVTELALTRPVLRVPLIRDAASAAVRPPTATPPRTSAVAIARMTVKDGMVIMANTADGVEDRIDGIDAAIDVDAQRRVIASGGALLGGRPATFDIKVDAAADAQPAPVELKFAAPDLLNGAIAAKAEVRLRGSLLQINGLSGTLGDGAFNGWASVDLAGKPQLKLDLDFQRLDLSDARRQPAPAGAPWSDARFDLTGLNYLDAQLRLSVAELNLGAAHVAPASIDARLAGGTLTAQFAQLGVYGGEASGELSIDAKPRIPATTLRASFKDVRARPLLAGLADFDRIDGKLQAEMALRADGDSVRAIMATLDGTASVTVRDGEIRGLNVAQMIRRLTTAPLSGWETNATEITDLTELAASFRIARGQAETADLALAGPLVRMTGAGTIDLGAKALALKVEPKLVLTTQGQSPQAQSPISGGGSSGEPVGLGIPVVIDGPWASPRIYPDTAGILDNPQAAYERLREMGQGLFGPRGGSGGSGPTDADSSLGESIGRLIQQGLQSGGSGRPPPPGTPGRPGADPDVNGIIKQLFGR